MRYMSVCSGVEAASLAWQGLGWEPVAFSEIEPFPCAVLAERFPDVPNLGDMTKIQGEEDGTITNGLCRIEGGIDLLVGGTPCQSFSVAGRREGLKGASGLAFHFVRLLREIQPKWFVWENVPGALSSRTDGQLDFNFLVGAFAECGYGLAWRILDAQYVRSKSFPFAIPQRRRRLFVVGCLGDGESAGKVLFDGESLSGDTPPRREAAQGASAPAAGGPEAPGERSVVSLVPYGMRLGAHEDGVASTIARIDAKFPQCVCKEEQQPREANGFNFELFTGECKEVSPCLGASRAGDTMVYDGEGKPKASWWDGSEKADTLPTTSDAQRMPDKGRLQCVVEMRQLEAETDGNVSPTLLSADYKGGKAVVETPEGESPDNAVCPTQEANLFNKNTFQDCDKFLIERGGDGQAVCFQQSQRDEVRLMSGDGAVAGAVCAMQATKQQNLIAYENHPQDGRVKESGDVSPAITAQAGTGGNNLPFVKQVDEKGVWRDEKSLPPCFHLNTRDELIPTEVPATLGAHSCATPGRMGPSVLKIDTVVDMMGGKTGCHISREDVSPTLATTHGESHAVAITRKDMACPEHLTVRRIMPVETERLMGFPDGWTRIPWRGKPAEQCPDGPRYKACGNSMCVNCMEWIGERIKKVERALQEERR